MKGPNFQVRSNSSHLLHPVKWGSWGEGGLPRSAHESCRLPIHMSSGCGRAQIVKSLLNRLLRKSMQTLLCNYHSFWCLARNINLINFNTCYKGTKISLTWAFSSETFSAETIWKIYRILRKRCLWTKNFVLCQIIFHILSQQERHFYEIRKYATWYISWEEKKTWKGFPFLTVKD